MSIRVAIIGCGYMGKNHMRILSQMSGVVITGACDVTSENREWVRQQYQIPVFERYADLLADSTSHAVIIAVPTSLHFPVAKYALLKNRDVMLEKPIAQTAAQGKELLEIAQARRRVFMVGHTERFNPMVRTMKKVMDEQKLGKILQVRVRRLSPFPGREQDVGVLMDLATHDLDILRYLMESPVDKLYCISRTLHSATFEDVAVLILTFENGVMATVNVSWVTPDKVRDIAVEGEKGMVVGNYLTQKLLLHPEFSPSAKVISIPVRRKEPLQMEISEFLHRVRTRDTSGETVVSAIEAVEMVEHALSRGQFLK